MANQKIVYKKIERDEFEKLHPIFDNDMEWNTYKENIYARFMRGESDICVIQDGEEFIGQIVINYTANSELKAKKKQRVYLDNFIIAKICRGMGMGQRLLKHVVNYTHTKGYTEFTISAKDTDEIAKHIFSKCGFNSQIENYANEFEAYGLYLKVINNQVTVRRFIEGKDEENLQELLEYFEMEHMAEFINKDYVYIWYDLNDTIAALLPNNVGVNLVIKEGYEDIMPKMFIILEEHLKAIFEDPETHKTKFVILASEKLDAHEDILTRYGYIKDDMGNWNKEN